MAETVWWLTGLNERTVRIDNPANNPTNPVNAQHPPSILGGASGFWTIWAIDEDNIWVGGDGWAVGASSNVFWRSNDGGTSWNNDFALHPGGGNGEIWDIWAFSTGEAWAASQINGGTSRILYWTGATWTSAAPNGHDFGAGGQRTNSVWGPSVSEMYCVSKTAGNNSLMRNLGAGWVAEGGGAGSLRAQLAADGGGDPIGITGDGTNLFVWCVCAGSGQVYTGTFQGGWARDVRSWGAVTMDVQTGKRIMADETGAVWVLVPRAAGGYEFHRRDPGTGNWALSHQVLVIAGITGGIFVVNSENIIGGRSNNISIYDGTTWFDYDTNARWGWTTNGTCGVYGYIPDSIAPYVERRSPAANSIGAARNTLISFDVVDADSAVDVSTIDAYVNGVDAYDGTTGFVAPYNGALSSYTFLPSGSIDGYDAHRIVIDNTGLFSYNETVNMRVTGADTLANWMNVSWRFKITGYIFFPVNKLYFSDGYGLKTISLTNLVGEAQTQASTIVEYPFIKSNNIHHIHGNSVDGYLLLGLSYDGYLVGSDAYGASVLRDETAGIKHFADNSHVDKAQITDDGILYLINQTYNRIDVFYGTGILAGRTTPDFSYSSTSTPAIMPGQILSLKIIEDASLRYSNGTRLFVGTSQGLTRIEAYDSQRPDGYGDGYDGYGLAINYGIVGSGATFEVIGGTAPQVVAVDFNEEKSTILVCTDDGYSNGGLTQISLTGNSRILFMDQSSGLLPSGVINDISGGN